jgi:hypothetical protein
MPGKLRQSFSSRPADIFRQDHHVGFVVRLVSPVFQILNANGDLAPQRSPMPLFEPGRLDAPTEEFSLLVGIHLRCRCLDFLQRVHTFFVALVLGLEQFHENCSR